MSTYIFNDKLSFDKESLLKRAKERKRNKKKWQEDDCATYEEVMVSFLSFDSASSEVKDNS